MSTTTPDHALFPDKSFWIRFLPGWLIGILAAYFPTSFFFNFYPAHIQFIFLSLIFQSVCISIACVFLIDPSKIFKLNLRRDVTTLFVLIEALCLCIATVAVAWKFPGLFDHHILFMDPALLPLFLVLALVSGSGMLILVGTLQNKNILEALNQKSAFKQVQANLPGIALALIFFFTYFTLAESLNFPNFYTVDQYFDLDISDWLTRLATPQRLDVISTRAVHPAVLVFLRPIIWFMSILLDGNRLQAVFLVNALAGAACVFVFWLIVKQMTGNTTYALSLAAMLGASTSHLIFSAMLESYIYSALAMIIFVLVIRGEKKGLQYTVPAGILVFGVTITNLVQTCILYFLAYPKIKTILKYVFLVLIATVLLNAVQVWAYPNAKSMIQPSNLLVEKYYQFNFERDAWLVQGRISLTVRAILLYGVIAPTPFILTQELGVIDPHFRTFKIQSGEFHVAGYTGLADITVKLWVLMIAIAGILFLLDLFKTPKQMLFPISLLACLGFNLALHIAYGDDPLLYSPDWVYALILFIAFAFRKWADQQWLHIVMLIFLALMLSTNLNLLHQIMQVTAPFYG